MYCPDADACIREIRAYLDRPPEGRALVVDADDYDVLHAVSARLALDPTLDRVALSDFCQGDDMPSAEHALERVSGPGRYVLTGLAPHALLESAAAVGKMVRLALQLSPRGHAVILLDHCSAYLQSAVSRDQRLDRRVVIAAGEASELPRIRLAARAEDCLGAQPLHGYKRLLQALEGMTDEALRRRSELTVVTRFTSRLFAEAAYPVAQALGVFAQMAALYPEIGLTLEAGNGTESQWRDLADRLQRQHTLTAVCTELFGSTANLPSNLGDVYEEGEGEKRWYLWLFMKAFGVANNAYLDRALQGSASADDLEARIYMELLDVEPDEGDFGSFYQQRKRLIEALPENWELVNAYCARVGAHGRDAAYYLTDASQQEELELMKLLAFYEYTPRELEDIAARAFPKLHAYLRRFSFTPANMKLAESEAPLREELTRYFQDYKLQKLTNRIWPEFKAQVEAYAESRPYNKLQPRSSIVSHMDRQGAQLYFFDALGVEYLSFIQERCEKYGLIAEIAVASSRLPTITAENKEFIPLFAGECRSVKDLDEVKHHSQVYDYQQRKEPIHLFRELEIIDDELRRIRAALQRGDFKAAVIVSDHGASRLAVINDHESDAIHELEEKGVHSGRCCPAEADPHLPFVAWENGYAVIANYDRIRGGRKANVEAHGGATLEEVLVPVIRLSRRPAAIEIGFDQDEVVIRARQPVEVVLHANVPFTAPRLLVKNVHGQDVLYEGEFVVDQKRFKFILPEIKRANTYTVDVYDGDRLMAADLSFKATKATTERNYF